VPSSLALHALLSAGVSPDDPTVRKGLKRFLDVSRLPDSTWEAAALLLAVTSTARAPTPEKGTVGRLAPRSKLAGAQRKWAQDLVASLAKGRSDRGWAAGPLRGDASASAGADGVATTGFVATALFAADRCGIRVPKRVWSDVLAWVPSRQERAASRPAASLSRAPDPRGTPVYVAPAEVAARGFVEGDPTADDPSPTARPEATAAALATILLARSVLASYEPGPVAETELPSATRSLYDGFSWLAGHAWLGKEPDAWLPLPRILSSAALDLFEVESVDGLDGFALESRRIVGAWLADPTRATRTSATAEEVLETAAGLLVLTRPWRGALSRE
jgi:hypothetical protein